MSCKKNKIIEEFMSKDKKVKKCVCCRDKMKKYYKSKKEDKKLETKEDKKEDTKKKEDKKLETKEEEIENELYEDILDECNEIFNIMICKDKHITKQNELMKKIKQIKYKRFNYENPEISGKLCFSCSKCKTKNIYDIFS